MLILLKCFSVNVINEDFGRIFFGSSFILFLLFPAYFDFTSLFRPRLETEINQIAVCFLTEVLSYPTTKISF